MKINLNGTWTLTGPNLKKTVPAVVPGSVYNDLLREGLIKDPFYRDNDRKLLALMEDDYHYSKTFIYKSSDKNRAVDLVFNGIDTVGAIYLNGKLVAKTYNMHRRYRFRINRFLEEGENHLKVVLKSPLKYMEKEAQKTGYRLMQMAATVKNYPYIRKAHAMFGWDWGPQLPDAGIWRDVYMETTTVGRIKDIYFFQETNRKESKVTVKVESEIIKPCRMELILSQNDEIIYRTNLAAAAVNTHYFTVTEPELWNPAGYGRASLYRLTLILKTDKETVDTKNLTVGFRTVKLIREKDAYGESFKFNINGTDVFLKGANYIIEDNLLARMSPERTEKLIRAARDANFNAIRVWGGGIYPPDYFYELCDAYGLVVWQDLMFACSYYDMSNDDFRKEIAAEIIDNVKRFRNHPSLGLICGNNENEAAIEWHPPDIEASRRYYIEQYERFIPKILAEVAPDIIYWPSSPSSGGSFKNTNDPTGGDVHYWDVWHGLKPIAAYREIIPRFLSEFGMQSYPGDKTIAAFTRPADRNPCSYVFDHHQRCRDGNAKVAYYLARMFRLPESFSDYVYLTQIMQAEAIRLAVEHLRQNYPRSMGSLYWQLNDCWPGVTWSGIDCYGRYKALHYYATRFYASVLLSLKENIPRREAAIYMTNETGSDITGEYRWRLITLKGEVRREGAGPFKIASYRAAKIATAPFNVKEEELSRVFMIAEAKADNGNVYRNHAALVPVKYLELEKPSYRFDLTAKDGHYRLTITADCLVAFLEIDTDKADIVFSDNYFFLYPKQKKIVTWQSERKITLADLKIRSLIDTY